MVNISVPTSFLWPWQHEVTVFAQACIPFYSSTVAKQRNNYSFCKFVVWSYSWQWFRILYWKYFDATQDIISVNCKLESKCQCTFVLSVSQSDESWSLRECEMSRWSNITDKAYSECMYPCIAVLLSDTGPPSVWVGGGYQSPGRPVHMPNRCGHPAVGEWAAERPDRVVPP